METLAKEFRVRERIEAWIAYRAAYSEPKLYCQLKSDLYQVRNPDLHGARPLSAWPSHLLDPDPDVLAAVEHYFLCRCWVGSGIQPAWQMHVMRNVFEVGQHLGFAPADTSVNPNPPLTALQRRFEHEGIRDGKLDRQYAGVQAPMVSRPPTY